MSHDAATEANGIDSKVTNFANRPFKSGPNKLVTQIFLFNELKIAKHDRSKELLESWLNKVLKIQITDGRVLIGTFLCTDRDLNIILGSCLEYVNDDKGKYCEFIFDHPNAQTVSPDPQTGSTEEEPRSLGLVMVPGKHVVSIGVDVQTDDV